MANVKLKRKKTNGYEQLYPQTLAKNVITGTGNVDTDILQLRQRINGLEYLKPPVIIEVLAKDFSGDYQYYDAYGWEATKFYNTEANLKIVFNSTNQAKYIVIDATDDMGMTMNHEIHAGLYNNEFEKNEIDTGKIYNLLYYNYQYYLIY